MLTTSKENIAPKVALAVFRQLSLLSTKKIEGIHLQPTEDAQEIEAEMEGPANTPYEGGVFKVKLSLSTEFPSVPPKAFFLTKIFHPNISDKGEVCVNTLKRDWDPADWNISQILLTIRCLLIVPFPESALNEEAGRLFMESYDEYSKHAQMITNVHAKRICEAEDTKKKVSKAALKTKKSLRRL